MSKTTPWGNERCIAVIPCLNEAATIAGLVARVRQQLPWVIVIDDGSVDSTEAEALSAGAQVIRHSCNLGKGVALRTAFAHCRTLGYRWAVLLDGDGQHAPEDIPLLFACAQSTGADLVIGDRTHQAERMPLLRRWVNEWMSAQISRLAGTPVQDSQCGFRLINLESLSKVSLKAERFETESEVLVGFLKAGLRVEFVPVQVIYGTGRSKIRPLKDTFRWFCWWFSQK